VASSSLALIFLFLITILLRAVAGYPNCSRYRKVRRKREGRKTNQRGKVVAEAAEE
jgi:uncharacterized protein HemY